MADKQQCLAAMTRPVEPGDLVPCYVCDGRGWFRYGDDKGLQHPRVCRACKGMKYEVIEDDQEARK